MKYLLTIAFLVVATIANAQINATTDDGRKVSLNPVDNTWCYVIEEMPVKGVSTVADYSKATLLSIEEDEVAGKSYLGFANSLVVSEDGKNGFGIYAFKTLNKNNANIIMTITAIGAGNCIDDDDNTTFLFRDGSRIVSKNDGEFNCKQKFTKYFAGSLSNKLNKELLQSLTTKEINIMRVQTNDSYVEQTFSPHESKILLNSLMCLNE